MLTARSRLSSIVGVGLCLAGGLLLGFARAAEAPQAPETVSGKVFLDANRNGRLDAGESGLAGIRVTDGVEFATTAADGSYRLTIAPDPLIPHLPARTVAVSWPSGKWPTGRWWARLSDVTDAQHVDFGLREDVQKLPFTFVHISDDHGSGKAYGAAYAPLVRRMGDAVKFCFNTGDMGYADLAGADAMFQSIAAEAAKFPVPMFISPGNHDFVPEDPKKNALIGSHPLVGNGAATKYCGPIRWSFDYAGVHFIALDYKDKIGARYKGRVPPIAVEWAEKDLAAVEKGTRIVMLVHCFDAPAEFFRLLKKYKPVYVCAGHTHVPMYFRLAGAPSYTNFDLATLVVTEKAVDLAEVSSAVPSKEKKAPPSGYLSGVVWPAVEKRRQKQHNLAEGPLGDAPKQLQGDPAAESAELVAEIEPGSASRVVVRFGQKETVDIAFDGRSVDVAGAPFPIGLPPGEKTLRWRVLMDRDRLTIAGNDIFRITKAVKVDAPARVAISAEGSGAALRKVDLWELRTIRNQNSRSLYHFPPPGWTWGTGQLQGACLEQTDAASQEMLKRLSPDGIKDYDIE